MTLDNDYDSDGNNIVPCPICLDVHCPSKEEGKCPDEDEFVRAMTTNTPEAWEETQKKAIYAILDKMYANKNYIDCAYEDIRSLLHTTKVELLRSIQEQKCDAGDIVTGYVVPLPDILSLASRHGITEEELNQKQV